MQEKEFREQVKTTDWTNFSEKYVTIFCSVDAIVPVWAYMLIASQLEPYAKRVVFGNLNTLETTLFMESMNALNPNDFKGERIVVNGCGEVPIPESAFVELVNKLKPVAKSIMYGEACSTVPVYKQPK